MLDIDRLRAACRADLAAQINREITDADAIVARQHGRWRSVADIFEIDGHTNYYPTCRADLHPEAEQLANIFDRAMDLIGDRRRAFRVPARAA